MSTGVSYIAAGVRTDCENLLADFVAKNSLRFDDFIEVWQKMRFSLIYCGRKTFSELVEFTEEVLQIAKTFMLPPHSLQIRAGGVYLSAGLYYKQPTSGHVKIRFTSEDLSNIKPFLNELRNAGHYDVIFMFSKMLAENAFLFTLSPRTYGIEFSIRKYLLYKPGDDNYNVMREEESSDEEDFTPEKFASDFLKKSKLFDSLQDIETRYNSMKNLLYGDKEGHLPKCLSYSHPSILDAMNAGISSKNPPTVKVEDSSQRKLKKDSFKRSNKTEKTKALERTNPDQERVAESEDNMPSTSKKPAREFSNFPAEEWTAFSHPKNRLQLRYSREFESTVKSQVAVPVETENVPSSSSAEASGLYSLLEL